MTTREELIDALVEAAHESCDHDGLRLDWARDEFAKVLSGYSVMTFAELVDHEHNVRISARGEQEVVDR